MTYSRNEDELRKAVTSVAFGGPEMSDMYIVTADNLDDESHRGTIFRCSPGLQGTPTPLATSCSSSTMFANGKRYSSLERGWSNDGQRVMGGNR